mmetsp:Transcript_56842/g.135336  ORF Transcript_56842/g.135336 Transcript_56842/m.135336 type:complete len:92 (-) Transcript_56842:19-294(-)
MLAESQKERRVVEQLLGIAAPEKSQQAKEAEEYLYEASDAGPQDHQQAEEKQISRSKGRRCGAQGCDLGARDLDPRDGRPRLATLTGAEWS